MLEFYFPCEVPRRYSMENNEESIFHQSSATDETISEICHFQNTKPFHNFIMAIKTSPKRYKIPHFTEYKCETVIKWMDAIWRPKEMVFILAIDLYYCGRFIWIHSSFLRTSIYMNSVFHIFWKRDLYQRR